VVWISTPFQVAFSSYSLLLCFTSCGVNNLFLLHRLASVQTEETDSKEDLDFFFPATRSDSPFFFFDICRGGGVCRFLLVLVSD
jgi:hypothetical protein